MMLEERLQRYFEKAIDMVFMSDEFDEDHISHSHSSHEGSTDGDQDSSGHSKQQTLVGDKNLSDEVSLMEIYRNSGVDDIALNSSSIVRSNPQVNYHQYMIQDEHIVHDPSSIVNEYVYVLSQDTANMSIKFDDECRNSDRSIINASISSPVGKQENSFLMKERRKTIPYQTEHSNKSLKKDMERLALIAAKAKAAEEVPPPPIQLTLLDKDKQILNAIAVKAKDSEEGGERSLSHNTPIESTQPKIFAVSGPNPSATSKLTQSMSVRISERISNYTDNIDKSRVGGKSIVSSPKPKEVLSPVEKLKRDKERLAAIAKKAESFEKVTGLAAGVTAPEAEVSDPCGPPVVPDVLIEEAKAAEENVSRAEVVYGGVLLRKTQDVKTKAAAVKLTSPEKHVMPLKSPRVVSVTHPVGRSAGAPSAVAKHPVSRAAVVDASADGGIETSVPTIYGGVKLRKAVRAMSPMRSPDATQAAALVTTEAAAAPIALGVAKPIKEPVQPRTVTSSVSSSTSAWKKVCEIPSWTTIVAAKKKCKDEMTLSAVAAKSKSLESGLRWNELKYKTDYMATRGLSSDGSEIIDKTQFYTHCRLLFPTPSDNTSKKLTHEVTVESKSAKIGTPATGTPACGVIDTTAAVDTPAKVAHRSAAFQLRQTPSSPVPTPTLPSSSHVHRSLSTTPKWPLVSNSQATSKSAELYLEKSKDSLAKTERLEKKRVIEGQYMRSFDKHGPLYGKSNLVKALMMPIDFPLR